MAPPQPDEIELSAFGPAYGESLLVHLGEGEWMIVDSCKKGDRLPVLDHLAAMGVDAAAVKLVVATHWHDDHVRGISEVVTACPNARFACSGVLCADELVQAIGSIPPARLGHMTSGVKEMRAVFEVVAGREPWPEAAWAFEDRKLFRREGSHCEVRAVAPCDRVFRESQQRIGRLLETGVSWRVPRPDRNLAAVVLWVEVGSATLLLGADLEETSDDHTGWTRVIGCLEGSDRRSEVFKVPHHGSKNAHQELVWSELLVERPEAVVCPNERGAHQLPTSSDLERLCGLGNVHLTARPRAGTTMRRGRPGRTAVGDIGRVTLRRRVSPGGSWSVSYGHPAQNGCPPSGSAPPDQPP